MGRLKPAEPGTHTGIPGTHTGKPPDAGTAAIEFIFASVILLIPVVYLVMTISTVQAGSYATQAIAIDAARVASRYPQTVTERVDATAALHLEDFGLENTPYRVTFECSQECGTPGSLVTAHVETRVPIPGLPLVFGNDHAGRVTVTASHSDVVAPRDRGDP